VVVCGGRFHQLQPCTQTDLANNLLHSRVGFLLLISSDLHSIAEELGDAAAALEPAFVIGGRGTCKFEHFRNENKE